MMVGLKDKPVAETFCRELRTASEAVATEEEP